MTNKWPKQQKCTTNISFINGRFEIKGTSLESYFLIKNRKVLAKVSLNPLSANPEKWLNTLKQFF